MYRQEYNSAGAYGPAQFCAGPLAASLLTYGPQLTIRSHNVLIDDNGSDVQHLLKQLR